MKIHPRNIEMMMITTMGCPNSCPHCYLSCSPGKAKYRLSLEDMKWTIYYAAELGIRSVSITGGEPTLLGGDLLEVLKYNKQDVGIYLTLRTAGGWAHDTQIARDFLTFAKEYGVGSLPLSWDEYHAGGVPLDCIKNIVDVCRDIDLPTSIDWCGFESAMEVRGKLGKYYRYVRHDDGATVPQLIGARCEGGSIEESLFDWYWSDEFTKQCGYCPGRGERFLLIVYPDGLVSLGPECCFPQFLRRRPAGENWISQLIEETEREPAIRIATDEGYPGLLEYAVRRGLPPDKVREMTGNSACQVCLSLIDYFEGSWETMHQPLFADLGPGDAAKTWAAVSRNLRKYLPAPGGGGGDAP